MPDARRSRFRHDPEVIRALHARYIAGEDPAALAQEIGIGRNALLCQFHHKGLGGRVQHHWWTQKELRQSMDRYRQGESLKRIAEGLGVTEDRLYRALLAADIGFTEKEDQDRQTRMYFADARMYGMRKEGASYAEIAQAMGWRTDPIGRRRVGRRITRYCERIGISIPVVEAVRRCDGSIRRLGYSSEILAAMEQRIERARSQRPKGKRRR
jgi:hypothetical protein